MSEIRSSLLLGVCPQANVLWDELSVVDHLNIHAGMTTKERELKNVS